jgi:hypothetical protein
VRLIVKEGKIAANTQNCSKLRAIGRERYDIESVDSFTCLGSLVIGDNNSSEEITNRLVAANKSYFQLRR